MKKTLFNSIIIMLLFISCQDVGENKPLLSNSTKKQPVIIVNKNRHLNMAEFWIDRVKNPNKIIMTQEEIQEFNNKVTWRGDILNNFKDINKSYETSWIKSHILKSYKSLRGKAKYFEDGNKISNNFYTELKKDLNLDALNSIFTKSRYALVTHYCNQKIVPTDLLMLKKRNQIHFDRNQNSALDIATPLIILHSTEDKVWYYGVGPTSSGWVRAENIAFGTKEEIEGYLKFKNFVVTIEPKTALRVAGRYYDYLRMGVKLPLLLNVDNKSMVMIPTADENGKLTFTNATVTASNIHRGYLKYTTQNILTQAFKFLHLPYGWGGMYGEQDCSKFIQEVYAVVGITLPRNSSSQSNVGDVKLELNSITQNSKESFLRSFARAGETIIHLKGHITLYLGEYKGEPYIIHTVWGESSRHFALGRTAVTSLNFNNYLKKIDRITNITLKQQQRE